MAENNALMQLLAAVEQKAGRKMHTPKDFDYLHSCLFDECHTMVSVSTLKRIWGYVQSDGAPRPSSLDPLAQYAGYDSWEHFEQTAASEAIPTTEQPRRRWLLPLIVLIGILAALLAFYMLNTGKHLPPAAAKHHSDQRILRKGQDCFRTIEDYLSLFGIEGGDTAYFRPLPALEHVYVWGPEYGHPVWHNEGDTLQLMPTITEYWTPLSGEQDYHSEEYVKLANEKLYYERLNTDELRITFMRNLVDGFYVFLGIYRMDCEQSTPQKFVWRRVADECDLGQLDQLEDLRVP